jgi:hypothetical protein
MQKGNVVIMRKKIYASRAVDDLDSYVHMKC